MILKHSYRTFRSIQQREQLTRAALELQDKKDYIAATAAASRLLELARYDRYHMQLERLPNTALTFSPTLEESRYPSLYRYCATRLPTALRL